MNCALLVVLDDFIISDIANEISDAIANKLFARNFNISSKIQSTNNKDTLTQIIAGLLLSVDTLFVISETPPTAYFKDAVSVENNVHVISSVTGETSKTIVMLPLNIVDALRKLNEALAYFETAHKMNYKTEVYKAFGLTKKEALEAIKGLNRNRKELKVTIAESYLEVAIIITYSPKIKENILENLRYQIMQRLRPFIYADSDVTLVRRVLDYLEVRQKTLAVAESFTGGAISSLIVSVPGCGAHFLHGVTTYSSQSKTDVLGVPAAVVNQYGPASKEVAYEMAVGLLQRSRADVVVATTGVAGPDTDEFNTPIGKCFIAVGDMRSIDVYPYMFEGTRDEIRQYGTKYALALIIKKLMEDNFQLMDFNQPPPSSY